MSENGSTTEEPMIEVRALTKRFKNRVAVRDLSFSVGRGQIVGFLGPNGAGKTTTMRILSCYMPATSGVVRVGGCDVHTEPDAVRRQIGYMPENNPLHAEMRVREYLKFRARLKGLGVRRSRDRVDYVTEVCGLGDVTTKLIGHLSKGYRQRVGLADALVHEPGLLILDEPTIGLDPHQIRTVRKLIRELGRTHTVLVSSHILSEIEMTCDHVIIIHEGSILEDDTVEGLRHKMSAERHVIAEIAAPREELLNFLEHSAEILHFDLQPADSDHLHCILTPAGT
jgi:ABC-2 type transport system ATP-binding protein